MSKVALIIGHTPEAPGVCNEDEDLCEYTFNEHLAQHIPDKVQRADVELVFRGRPNDYRGLPDKVNATGADAAVSMHANGYNTRVSGTEVLHWHSSEEGRALAERLLGRFLKALNLNNRGLKGKHLDDRGGYLLGETAMPCVIAEPFFLDNTSDLHAALNNQERLANAYAEGIDRWLYDRENGG